MQDTTPRIISNLIVDQSGNNPAAVDAAGPGAEPARLGLVLHPNATPDGGLSAPYNSLFTLFGQFFDHGLDLVGKSGTESVVVPAAAGRPAVPAGLADQLHGRQPDGPERGGQATNTTTPYVDQNQTYTSHRRTRSSCASTPIVAGEPRRHGTPRRRTIAGNIANWTETKANAATDAGHPAGRHGRAQRAAAADRRVRALPARSQRVPAARDRPAAVVEGNPAAPDLDG